MNHPVIKAQLILISLLAYAALLGVSIYYPAQWEKTTPIDYSGKETFLTKKAYQDFKEAIALPDVRIYEVYSLNSDPPIIVDFRVNARPWVNFPYGKDLGNDVTAGRVLIPCAVVGVTLLILIAIVIVPAEPEGRTTI